jgi:thiamine biosynthesis lipoprotein
MQIFATESSTATSTKSSLDGAAMRRFRWSALGTVCELQFVCARADRAEAFFAQAAAWVENFEARYSRFRPDSELSRINAAAGQGWVEILPEMEQMLDICGSLYAMTQGLLDATSLPLMRLWNYRATTPILPEPDAIAVARQLVGWKKVERKPRYVRLPQIGMALDFGGWGKEYAVDAIAELARRSGIADGLVDFGHDLRAWGRPLGKPAWHIGLENPLSPGTHRGSVAIGDRGVASSGDYLRQFTVGGRRYGHIIDLRTGQPVTNGSIQATVIAPSCLQAGVLSTTAFVLGAQAGVKLIQETMGSEGMIQTVNTRYQTRGFFNYVVEN